MPAPREQPIAFEEACRGIVSEAAEKIHASAEVVSWHEAIALQKPGAPGDTVADLVLTYTRAWQSRETNSAALEFQLGSLDG